MADDCEALLGKVSFHLLERLPEWPATADRQAAAAILRDHVEAKLAEVRAEVERHKWNHRQANELTVSVQEKWEAEVAEQAAVIERLREALNAYGSHRHGCKRDFGERYACTCGLDDARTALQETANGK